MKKNNIIYLCVGLLLLTACNKDYLETSPTNKLPDKEIFATVTSAGTALEGVHRAMYKFGTAHDQFGQKSVDYYLESMGEDFYPTERGYGWFFAAFQWTEIRNVQAANVDYVWSFYYDLISNANRIIKNIDKIECLTSEEALRDNIKAQALTYRAYAHYNLVQIFAESYKIGGANTQLGVPYMLEPISDGQPRNTVAEVYAKVTADLDAAIALFSGKPSSRIDRSHIDLSIAQAIYARVGLTTGDWTKAATMAKVARSKYTLSPTYGIIFDGDGNIVSVWNQSSNPEWMWGANLIDEQQTSFASWFSHVDPYFGGYNSLGNQRLGSTQIYDFMNDSDMRKELFDTISGKPRVGYKFTTGGDWSKADYLYMKSGEMYLIEAEAQARSGNFVAAQDVLFDVVSMRDPEYVKPTLVGEALIDHIIMQRRCDLWGEGQRYFDLKRYNKGMDRNNCGMDLTQTNGVIVVPADDKRWLWLIPKQEMDSNPQMVQNPL